MHSDSTPHCSETNSKTATEDPERGASDFKGSFAEALFGFP